MEILRHICSIIFYSLIVVCIMLKIMKHYNVENVEEY